MSRTIMNLEESRELEARCAVRMGLDTLMRRAGTFAAKWLDERLPCPHVTVLAGPGNNGGDAIVCACELKRLGHTVQLVMPGGEPKTELAREMLADWIALGGTVISDPYMTEKADAVVDGLFGTGLKRPITGDYLDAILWFNERQCFRLALDVPSGLHSETGHWVGTMPGVTADATVTFLSAKSGLYMNEGVDAAGAVVVSELDVSVPLTRLGLIEYSDFDHICQPRPKFSHKGTFGHVAVVGGAEGHIGAALLSARAALRMGAGTVTVELLTPNAMMVDPVAPELMFSSTPLDFSRFTAAVIGPGLGQSAAAKARLEAALASNIPLVLDADALNLIAGDKALLTTLLHRTVATVLTPHEAEGARLLKVTPQIIQSDRVNAVRDIALQTGAITVLKGPGTLIAMRSSRTWLSPYATASLATAGSGDVLSGMIASFLGQRYDTVESVLGAVMLHGYAGQERVAGLTASEIAAIAVEPLETYRRTNARPYC
ncbi:NAD(P)H-hydrate dehydratase [Sutterella wadsworthensis]|uniref:NAD(P)H-hydrate dehydratase n=1 Tax=Sutterella wadsworthensis TaxID=40545 RepID=UPI00266C1CA6|nr:NAD(P)H-hydrate dehydratase [Sutterella wadsworthensis]